ncbi:MAG: hypothetical protein JO078_05995 [Candidatus Eremiobacteraeota bacterium]|nr:hypothetical protein [Candidatus Eremiobacteraeota bacterium]MBV9057503.1 hypothetical protein [Candidatus Eremiobacteraeota bacterium]MBV9699656.1 hypothetical protein [Candidatus Eremiobacteraeota bacterium]
MLKRLYRALPATLLLATLAVPLSAVAAPPSPHMRVENQRDRITRGYQNGGISQKQHTQDIARLQAIRQQMKAQRERNGGHLTPQQREHAYQRLNHLGEHIYDQRHDQRQDRQPPR